MRKNLFERITERQMAASSVTGADAKLDDDAAAAPAPEAEAAPAAAPAATPEPEAAPEPAPVVDSAVEIVRLCNDAGYPQLAEKLLSDGVSLEVAMARIEVAKAITAKVEMARKVRPEIDPAMASAFIEAGASLEHVQAQLFETMAAMQSQPALNVHGTEVETNTAPETADLNPAGVYARRADERKEWLVGHV